MEFDSLTKALEGWFDKSLQDLPSDLQARVDKDLLPFLLNSAQASSDHPLYLIRETNFTSST